MGRSSISRRLFVLQAAAVGLTARSWASATGPGATPVRVQLNNGKLRGTGRNGVDAFLGVPFAEPPTGPLRFRAPVAKRPWTQELDATSFAPMAMQTPRPSPTATPGNAASDTPNEDCLYLNVWAPQRSGHFPVFVWIHGGALMGGRSSDPTFDGETFARAGIVCITIAYRLAAFGFLDLEPLLGPSYAGSANNGLLDVMQALEWVQTNAAAFGGDPKRVTVAGESAGAKLVATLMGTPSAKPLFHQMISESGGADRIFPQKAAMDVSRAFGEVWRKETSSDVPDMLTAAPEKIIKVQEAFIRSWPLRFPFRPEIDGTLIPRAPIESIAMGLTKDKRLLLGTNKNEGAPFPGQKMGATPDAKELANLPLAQFMNVYSHYGETYPNMDPVNLHIQGLTAEEYWVPSMRVLDAHVKAGGQAWDYRLDFTEQAGAPPYYSYHSLDLALVWDKPRTAIENIAAETVLAEKVHTAWSAFIKGEAPDAPGLPRWPAYRSDTRPTMILNVDSHLENNPLNPELHLWDGKL